MGRGYQGWRGDHQCGVSAVLCRWAGCTSSPRRRLRIRHQAIHIQEPCSHPVVFSGLCAVCGKDLDEMCVGVVAPWVCTRAKLVVPPSQGRLPQRRGRCGPILRRAVAIRPCCQRGQPVRRRRQLPRRPCDRPRGLADQGVCRGGSPYPSLFSLARHTDPPLTMLAGPQEAHRLAQTQRTHLLKARRLIMVVDLDQTVIHAAVDPTIGEWLNECGFWEASRLGAQGAQAQQQQRSTTPDGEPREDKGKGKGTAKAKAMRENPNKEALRDVFRFQLPNEMPAGFAKGRFSQALPEDGEGCWYYIKPR